MLNATKLLKSNLQNMWSEYFHVNLFYRIVSYRIVFSVSIVNLAKKFTTVLEISNFS